MEKNEKLALARKKLRKFQAKTAAAHNDRHSPTEPHSLILPVTKHVKLGIDPQTRSNDDVHSQTIDILVSEKTDLMNKLSSSQTQLQIKQLECSRLNDEVCSLRNQMDEIQREREKLVTSLKEKTKLLSHHSTEDNNLRVTLQQSHTTLEELQQENSELLSKVTRQSSELKILQQAKDEMESKINMYELLTQQLQSSQPTTPVVDGHGFREKVELLEGEIAHLSATVQSLRRERDQGLSDIAALRDTMMQNKQEAARKVGDLQTQLKESEIQLSTLKQQLTAFQQKDASQNQMKEEVARVRQHELLEIQRERDNLQLQLQQLISSNKQLSEMHAESEDKVIKLESDLNRIKGEVVDQQNLLSTIEQDKETISRAVSQNKELKERLAELQDAFVQQSHQNMELASTLDTEKRRRERLEGQCQDLERGLTSERTRVAQLVDELEEVRENSEVNQGEQDVPRNTSVIEENSKIHELSMECTSLKEERDKLLEEIQRLSSPSPPSAMEEHDDSTSDTNQQLSTLQQSFSALQGHFIAVMHEKAELEDQLQESEHRLTQLEGETETIGEYITLYQTQREALKAKFLEKDRLIQQLLQEKALLELRLREVQGLVQQLDHSEDHTSSLPTHLRSPSEHKDNKQTVGHIVSIIEELTTTASSGATMQCPCCSGNLIVV